MLHSVLAPASPPQERCRQQEENRDRRYRIRFTSRCQPFPMLAEQIARAGNHRHPQRRAQKVEDHELPPRHPQDSRHRPGDDPHSEHEARKEDRNRAVSREQFFSALQSPVLNSEKGLVARPAADVRRSSPRQNPDCRPASPRWSQPRRSREAADRARNRPENSPATESFPPAPALRHSPPEGRAHGPISVMHHRIPQQVENGGVMMLT